MADSREQGYEDDRFENVVSQNFHCPICLNVLKDPVMCQRNQHYFCRPCITRHLENSQTCPSCQEELTLATLNKAPRILTDYLSELKIRCAYFSRGCQEFVELGDLETHVNDCGFTPVLCSNEGCVLEMDKRDRTQHESRVCEFRKLKCHSCSEIRKEMDEVKVNLTEVKVHLMEVKVNLTEVNEKLDGMEEMKQKVDELATLSDSQEEIKTELDAVKAKLDKMEENQHKFDQLATDIEKMKEEIMKEVRGTDNYSNNIKPSVVLVAGGCNDNSGVLRSVEMFNCSKKTWSPMQPMKEFRRGASSIVYKNQLTVTGGDTDEGRTDTMERIDINPVTDFTQWSDVPAKLPGKLWGHSSVVYNERLIAIGGHNNKRCSDSIHEVLLVEPYTRNFLSRMPQPRWLHGTQLFNDKILIVGGTKTLNCKDSLASVLMYDINKKESREMAPLPFAVCEMATVRWGDNIIVIGGANKDGKALNTVVIYNVETGKSHMLPEIKHKRIGCRAVVSQGTIVLMGGLNDHDVYLNSVECFSFDRYSWEDLPPMNEARYLATAVTW